MQHKGEIVEKHVRKSGISITRMGQLLGVSRSTMYDIFHDDNVSIERIIRIGQIIHHDFSEDFPELKKYEQKKTNENLTDGRDSYNSQNDYWRAKYLDLLEEHTKLLRKYQALIKRK